MARIPLIGGAYSSRSVIANAQRCINYAPELNRQDAPSPFTLYQRGGLRPLVTGAVPAPVRGIWRASNGNGYCVIGQNVYAIGTGWALTLLGTLLTSSTAPTSATDNGTTILLVDSSTYGYTIDMATNAFAVVTDPTSTFTGATRVDYIDTFVLWNIPGTNRYGATLSNTITFDALYVAAKTAYPDKLASLIVNRHEIILLGTLKSEIWYDAGNAGFPFAILPGAYVEHGMVAPYSVASQDIEIFWLNQDLQGQGIVLALKGYDTRRISNHALEWAISQMSTISDAIGWTYQQGGHTYYVLTFPSADQTWVYDASLGDHPDMAWHQECWTDSSGNLHRHRARCGALINGVNVVGDHTNGTLYQVDPNYYYDEVGGVAGPISCIRGFPHNFAGTQAGTLAEAVFPSDNRMMQYSRLMIDMEVGNGALDSLGAEQQVTLRWSTDRGNTFTHSALIPNGSPGQYETVEQWRPLGMARDMVFEISHSIPGAAALQGVWVDAKVMNQ